MRQAPRVTAFHAWGDFLLPWLDRCPTDMLAGLSALGPLKIHEDPEFVFRVGWLLCDVGEHEQGLLYLRRALTKAYFVARLSRSVGRSIRCEAIHASRRFWRKRKWADSKRWPPSAKPEGSTPRPVTHQRVDDRRSGDRLALAVGGDLDVKIEAPLETAAR